MRSSSFRSELIEFECSLTQMFPRRARRRDVIGEEIEQERGEHSPVEPGM